MFAIDHAATALVLKRRYPSVPMTPLLLSVQAMELAWVALNYLGIERTATAPVVRTVANIRLEHMPYSHSVAIPVAVAVLAWLVLEKGLGRVALGRAVGLGILSHLVLDLATHNHDIVLWPGRASPALGIGLYGSAPMMAFALELAYGIACWRIYRGSRGLLVLIIVANVANLSLFSSAIPGPEQLLAGRPLLVVTFVLVQIVATLLLVGAFARRSPSMITIRNTILIRRPVEEVFAYVADFENIPKWNYYVKSVVRTTPETIGLGATFHQVRKTDSQDYRVVEYEPSRVVAMRTLPPERQLTMRFSLSVADGGTQLVDEWTFDAGWATPLVAMARGRIRRAVATNLEKLRDLLEASVTQLPDGRISRR